MPPFIFQALLRAESRTLQQAIDFLQQARELLNDDGLVVNEPVPMTITRVAGIERAQLLIECASRMHLQARLSSWMQTLRQRKSRLRWTLEVDPVDI
jgi:primosomal protein N' (replication factor Y)